MTTEEAIAAMAQRLVGYQRDALARGRFAEANRLAWLLIDLADIRRALLLAGALTPKEQGNG